MSTRQGADSALSILHVVNQLGAGGMEHVVRRLALDQQARGCTVHAHAIGPRRSIDVVSEAGIAVTDAAPKKPGYDLGSFRQVLDLAAGYDLLHCHDVASLLRCAPVRLFRRAKGQGGRPRILYTAHGLTRLDRRRQRMAVGAALRLVDHVAAVSRETADVYGQELGVPQSRLTLLENGVDVGQSLAPPTPAGRKTRREKLLREYGIPVDAHLWISVATIKPLKNQAALVRALYGRPGGDSGQAGSPHLLLAGRPLDADYAQSLRALDPDGRVHFAGHVQDIRGLLEAGDLFVSASTQEGMPLSVLEAMACGIPCILSDIPGHRALSARDGAGTAKLFALRDDTELGRLAGELLQQDSERSRLTTRAHDMVRHHYTSDRMLADYRRLYARLLDPES